MKPTEFCYWLRGFFELAGEGPLTEEQVKIISDHLKLVMEEKSKPEGWMTVRGVETKRYCSNANGSDASDWVKQGVEDGFITISC